MNILSLRMAQKLTHGYKPVLLRRRQSASSNKAVVHANSTLTLWTLVFCQLLYYLHSIYAEL